MLRLFYNTTMRLSAHPRAKYFLFLVSFAESSVFLIPPDVILIPMVLAARHAAWRIATICTLASVAGGVFGYFIGHLFFEEIGRPILTAYQYDLKFEHFQMEYNQWGAWAVFFAGVTPFPYKVITILSGMTGLDLTIFIIASILARGLRFFLIAWLLWKFGASIQDFIDRRLGVLFFLFCILLIGGFVIIKFL